MANALHTITTVHYHHHQLVILDWFCASMEFAELLFNVQTFHTTDALYSNVLMAHAHPIGIIVFALLHFKGVGMNLVLQLAQLAQCKIQPQQIQ